MNDFADGCVLAFDYGTRLIGVAIGHRGTGSARALCTVTNTPAAVDWKALDALFKEWRPGQFVVGLPLTLDGGEQPMSTAARAFAAELTQRYQRPAYTVDERNTSKQASQRFALQRAQGTAKRKHAAQIDALAAQIILENWLAAPHSDAD